MRTMKQTFLAILVIVPAVLFGQLDRSQRPLAGKAPVINIANSEVFTLPNGLTVILSENHKLPRVSFDMFVSGSPRLEGELTGLSQITGDLILSGTSKRTKDQFDAEKDYIGASISASSSSLRLSCLSKHMDKGLDLMSDVLKNANFPQDEVNRIVKQSESGLLSAKSDANTMASNALSKLSFPGHPFGEVMTEEHLKRISREAIEGFYKEQFSPKGAYLVIVGDIDRAKAEAMSLKYFGDWQGMEPFKTAYPVNNTNKGRRVAFVNKPGAVQSVINVSFPFDMSPAHPDYLHLNVLNGILGGGVFGNRLMQNLREDKAYTYGCRSGLDIDEYGSLFTAYGNFRNDVTDSAIHEIIYELERITQEAVSDKELDLTKAGMAGSFARSLESPATVARFAYNVIRYNLPKDYYQNYLKRLESITKEELLGIAKKYVAHDRCNIVVVGNDEVVERITRFDGDGKIERMDAFGNPTSDRKASDLTADQLLEKYTFRVTSGLQGKTLTKKLAKIKSMEEVYEIQFPQAPFPMSLTKVWTAPNGEYTKMEGNGMVFQKTYFDGKEGFESNIQTGIKALSPEKLAAKQKSTGLFPEMNYKTSGMTYEMLGIESLGGRDHYVILLNDGDGETYEYYDFESYLKSQQVTIKKVGDDVQETTVVYDEYTLDNGFMFPNSMTLIVSETSIPAKIKSRTFNQKIDTNSFK